MPHILLPIGIFVIVVTIVIGVLIATRIWERRRTEAFQQLARQLNFEFHPTGRAELMNELSGFHLFGIGHSKRLFNLLEGEAGGTRVSIFDYRYVTGGGKHQHVWTQSVFVARCDGMALSQFSIRPESIWNKIGSFFGMQDINFDTHPKFSKMYLLRGPDEGSIRRLFAPEILEYFEASPRLNVEGAGDLILFSKYNRLAPDGIRDFMAEGFELLKLFQQHATT